MPDAPDRLEALVTDLRAFMREREWSTFHDPKNLSMLLASEAGELVSLLRWVPNAESDAYVRDPARREKVAHEVADAAIAVLLLCDRAGFDLVSIVRDKLAINARNYPVELARGRAERPLPVPPSGSGGG